MRKLLLKLVLKAKDFPGGSRLLRPAQKLLYAPYRQVMSDGVLYELDVFEWTQLEMAAGVYTEPNTVGLIRSLLQPGDCFVDVGAHVGSMGLIARKCIGPEGRVVSIEPQPYNGERLLRNWELNSFTNHILYVAAAGAKADRVTIPQQANTDKARLSLAVKMHDAIDLSFVVPVVTLDEIVLEQNIDRIRLLKIDVEGYEPEVLEGAGQMLSKVDNVIFEVLEDSEPERVTALRTRMSEYGFHLKTVTGDPWEGQLPLLERNVWAQRPS